MLTRFCMKQNMDESVWNNSCLLKTRDPFLSTR